MEPAIARNGKEDGTFWRKMLMAEEKRLPLFPMTARPGGYRWFQSENVVCIEHFRNHTGRDRRLGVSGGLKLKTEWLRRLRKVV
jgi:hypothetical protein